MKSYSLTNARLNHPHARSSRALRILMMIGALAAIIGFDTTAFAQACITSRGAPFTINGVLGFGMTPPAGCLPDSLSWAFIEPEDLTSSAPLAGQKAQIFLAGLKPTGAPSVQTLYVGIQFQKDAQLDVNDKLMLVFDATGNGGAFDNGDFAIVWNVGTDTAFSTALGERCAARVGTMKIYRFERGAWQSPANLPATIVMKTGWDYENVAPDPENEIYEIETSIDVAAHGLRVTGSPTFRMGARMVVVPPVGTANVWRFPSTMDTDDNPAHFDPTSVSGGFSAGTLATTAFDNCCECAPSGGIVGVVPMLILAGGTGWLYRRTSRSKRKKSEE